MLGRRKPTQEYGLTPVEFAPPTEITEDQLPSFYESLAASIGTVSLQAYVVRGADFKALSQFLVDLFPMGHKIDDGLTGHHTLHVHRGGELPAQQFTVHETLTGQAEVAVLDWRDATIADQPYKGSLAHYGVRTQAAHQNLNNELLEQARVRTHGHHPPIQAARTTLGPDDIFIFDHTLPHAFQSLTDDRRSQAYFM